RGIFFLHAGKDGKALFSVMEQPLTPAALCAASPAEASSHNVETGQSIMPTKHGWNLLFTLFASGSYPDMGGYDALLSLE
ncbi:hypothetical protein, partial [Halomonas sp. AOP43-D1-4]|uniref:hypothetical protein n=1 Tax=Halomonas sp. AOP43-D1-4 TaxID=3457658 RepID=UPI004033C0E5